MSTSDEPDESPSVSSDSSAATTSISTPSTESGPFDDQSTTQYPQSNFSATLSHPDARYQETQYQDAQYQDAQYQETRYQDTQSRDVHHPGVPYGDGQYAEAQYAGAQYAGAQYAAPQYSAPQYAATQYQTAPHSSGDYPGYPPGSGYPVYQSPRSSGGGGRAVLLGIAIACIIALAAAAVFIWLKVAGSDDDSSTTAQSDTVAVETRQQQPTTVAPPVDPEVAAGDSLRNQAATDAAAIRAGADNRWAAQVSSKRLGLVAEGRTWDNAAIWSEFESLQSRYPQVRLLNSGDWPVFSDPGWWVTVSAQSFPSAESALAWCRSVSLDKDHCFAKLISDSRGPEGTTLYQR